ncbi:MAG: PBPRA1643 family SWIM/SEC-C metal-binding motif protein [Bermanella sp.]
MSKFFYKGGLMKKPEHSSAGFEVKNTVRLGTKKAPAAITVKTEERKTELLAVLADNNWIGEVEVKADQEENLRDLEILESQKDTAAAVTTKQANRNDPCPCGSGKKYKKCCAA